MINLSFKYNARFNSLVAEWTAGDLLSFYGAILGSTITLIGIYFTLSYERKTRREDNSIIYKPILKFVGINEIVNTNFRNSGITFQDLYNLNPRVGNHKGFDDKYYEKLYFVFKNIGRGETSDTMLEEISNIKASWPLHQQFQNIFSTKYFGEIVKDDVILVVLSLPKYMFLPKNEDNIEELKLKFELNFQYKDMFMNKKYRLVNEINLNIIKRFKTDCVFTKNSDKYEEWKIRYKLDYLSPTVWHFHEDINLYLQKSMSKFD